MILKKNKIRELSLGVYEFVWGKEKKFCPAPKPLLEPFDEENCNPASYDFTLSNKFCKTAMMYGRSLTHDRNFKTFEFEQPQLTLTPGECVQALTNEYFRFPSNLCGMVKDKSTLGRLFITVCHSAGWCDPGWEGYLVLELVNHNTYPITLYAGQKIGQMVFMETTPGPDVYDGHYQTPADFALDSLKASTKKFYQQHQKWLEKKNATNP